jgi:hypothetical protein
MRGRDVIFLALAFVRITPLTAQAPVASGDARFQADTQVVLK